MRNSIMRALSVGQRLVGIVFLGVTALVTLTGTFVAADPANVANPKGLLTITFDDGSRSQYEHGLRLAQQRGLPGTIFIPTGLISAPSASESEEWLMSWEHVREFADAGWEIGVHGHSHISLPDLAPHVFEHELMAPIQEIEFQTGIRPVSFSSPFGAFTDETIEQIMTLYDFHLSWKGHGGRNPKTNLDPRYIGRLEITHEMQSTLVCGEMVRAAQNGNWLVLLFHGIVDANPKEYEVSVETYDEVLACAITLEEVGLLDVVSIRDATKSISIE